MFAPTKGLSHYGNFTLEKVKKHHAIYQFSLADKDGDSSIGHFKVNKRGVFSFFGEEGNDDSKLSKDDPLLFKGDAADSFNWADIYTKSQIKMQNLINSVGHYGTIAAKGFDADCLSPLAMCSPDNYDGLDLSERLMPRRSDDLSFGDIFSGIKYGISLAGSLTNSLDPVLPILL